VSGSISHVEPLYPTSHHLTTLGRHAPEHVRTVTVSERPDLADAAWERTKDVVPEHDNHGDVLNRYVWMRHDL